MSQKVNCHSRLPSAGRRKRESDVSLKNKTTKFKFAIPLLRGVSEGQGVLVRLVICDLLGKEIAALVNQELKPGTYETSWNGSRYPSGVYFYWLETGSFVETKKWYM